jgi:hypothetical protein
MYYYVTKKEIGETILANGLESGSFLIQKEIYPVWRALTGDDFAIEVDEAVPVEKSNKLGKDGFVTVDKVETNFLKVANLEEDETSLKAGMVEACRDVLDYLAGFAKVYCHYATQQEFLPSLPNNWKEVFAQELKTDLDLLDNVDFSVLPSHEWKMVFATSNTAGQSLTEKVNGLPLWKAVSEFNIPDDGLKEDRLRLTSTVLEKLGEDALDVDNVF